MVHLIRTPLLEFSRPSAQRKRPGGAAKSQSHRIRQKTSAAMPTRPGAHERRERSFAGRHFRMHQARDRTPAKSKRDAHRVRAESRPNPGHSLTRRPNPQARSKHLERRGNPQARSKTEVRKSPSKIEQRPTLPKTPKFLSRGDLVKGGRV